MSFTEAQMDNFIDIMNESGILTSVQSWSALEDIAKAMQTYHEREVLKIENKKQSIKWYNKLSDTDLIEVERKYKKIDNHKDMLEVFLLQQT